MGLLTGTKLRSAMEPEDLEEIDYLIEQIETANRRKTSRRMAAMYTQLTVRRQLTPVHEQWDIYESAAALVVPRQPDDSIRHLKAAYADRKLRARVARDIAAFQSNEPVRKQFRPATSSRAERRWLAAIAEKRIRCTKILALTARIEFIPDGIHRIRQSHVGKMTRKGKLIRAARRRYNSYVSKLEVYKLRYATRVTVRRYRWAISA